jgi:hypothetical protein
MKVRRSRPLGELEGHPGRGLAGAALCLAIFAAVVAGACGHSASSAPGAAARAATRRLFDARSFSNPTRVDNRYYPLIPGSQLVLEGEATRSDGRRPHRLVLTVTDLTKVISGVKTRVIWDVDSDNGVLAEAELAFHAQDDNGNVWNMGEYPEEYDGAGRFRGAPSTWLTGYQKAEAGLLMPKEPRAPRAGSYLQGYAPAVDFIDEAMTSKTGQSTCVPAKCYDDVLVTDEWVPNKASDGHQLKFYAPGVGNVRVEFRGGDEAESLVLVQARTLSSDELARVRTEALKLDKHGYEVNGDYARTAPAVAPPAV